jgi:protein-S-isoprenylcysteine O-methyltransferase Ste14
MHDTPAYGLWIAVLFNVVVFVVFAFSFSRPQTSRDWRSFGAYTAFIVALFTEMYGFPVTLYLLSGWLSKWLPGTDLFSHDSGHLWHTLFKLSGDPHSDPFHIASYFLIGGGMVLLIASWRVLHAAQQEHRLAQTGAYAVIRHPQYAAFIAMMLGFLFQWPTLLTLAMFPVLVFMYVRLAKYEEREAGKQFGEAYARYASETPAFIPRIRQRHVNQSQGGGL